MTFKRKYLTAFTLIELLVVISIIALLLSIMMPSLRKARESSKSTVCRSQLKQFALALGLYAEDNNGKFLLHEWLNEPPDYGYWFARISPYIDTRSKTPCTSKIMRCPSGLAIKDYGNQKVYSWSGTDYGLQYFLGKFYSIKQPSEFSSFFDFYYGSLGMSARQSQEVQSGSIWAAKWFSSVREDEKRDAEEWRPKIYRHNQSINALYIDGHTDKAKMDLSIGSDGKKRLNWWEDLASPSSLGWSTKPK